MESCLCIHACSILSEAHDSKSKCCMHSEQHRLWLSKYALCMLCLVSTHGLSVCACHPQERPHLLNLILSVWPFCGMTCTHTPGSVSLTQESHRAYKLTSNPSLCCSGTERLQQQTADSTVTTQEAKQDADNAMHLRVSATMFTKCRTMSPCQRPAAGAQQHRRKYYALDMLMPGHILDIAPDSIQSTTRHACCNANNKHVKRV